MKLFDSKGYAVIQQWLSSNGNQPFIFQEETWQHIIDGRSGLVNAPTGCGKTFSVFLGALIVFINHHPKDYKTKNKNGLQLLWITPLRALAKDIGRAMEEVIDELGMEIQKLQKGKSKQGKCPKCLSSLPKACIYY